MANRDYSIENHVLKGQTVRQMQCPKNTVKFARGMPDTIVIHYTGGRDGKSSAEYLCRDKVKASAHLVLDRNGTVFQLVPFDTIAWHAGESAWQGRTGYNKYSIGIEIDNAGILTRSGANYISWFGKKYRAEDVIEATHRNESQPRYWHLYSEEQIEYTEYVCEVLMDTYPTIETILGHEEISPGRKQDPGPAFPLDKLRLRMINNRDEEKAPDNNPIGEVAVPHLNIRELPDIQSPVVSDPLSQGTTVTVYETYQGWYRVKTEIEGWVAGNYVELK